MEKISVEVIYRYAGISGEEKVVHLRRKNIQSEKTEDQLTEAQDLTREGADETLEIECNVQVSDSGRMIYLLEIITPFFDREDGSAAAHELMDSFFEKAGIK